MGLDRPVPVQYWRYVTGLLRGDLGESSSTGRPVLEDFRQRIPATLELTLASLIVAVAIGIPFGVLSAVHRDTVLDHLSRGRLELGIGRGASPYELGMLNVDVAETKAMFDEALAIILMGLTTGRVDYAGQYYTFKDVLVPTRPYQQPYPPLWYPTSNPASMPWVARHGFSTLFTYTSRQLDEQRQMIVTYEQELVARRDRESALNRHVPYPRYGETPEATLAAILAMQGPISKGLEREALQAAMPAGAARNALDCALLDLEAKAAGPVRVRKGNWC